ncbi:hypothetical protein TBLA_0C03070 [Henningerozyma blattae CBS 6284]|uniref:Mrp8p n=1 Tax=Henningerozyma blattae (strain ATCC 34711 / CBS 6284 / DSM 70876 / NBRC 10599 / NRRL Y-10934 / UCD 77-7) TaxID=1071380 RepID=I2H159_HENB6|nr:hypothetical protein TBLA_0C03070 [Tetrapisispora blattae CBS 6284]CCH60111.1 hypothetical protein TBLA_0C03070 [Tetrapisispora blattae CBS 6284]
MSTTEEQALKKEVDDLKKQVAALQEIVQKQSLLISKTGENVMAMQVKNQGKEMEKMGITPARSSSADLINADIATNDDLVQLVGELQGQLDTIEERSIRRVVNSTKTKDDDVLAPLPNPDGDTPTFSDDLFPKTIGEFKAIDDFKLYRMAKFYEVLQPSMKQQEAFEDFMDGKAENFYSADLTDDEINAEIKKLSKDELEDAFNDLARYLGAVARRGESTW